MHQVQSAGANGRVVDTEGNSFRMSMVKAIPRSTAFVQVPEFAMGGSRKVEDRRREALRQWLPMLLERINRAGVRGLSVQQASKDLAMVPGFQQALRDQRATLLQFAQLWSDEISIEKRGTQNIMRAKRAPQSGMQQAKLAPQEPDAAAARPQEPGAAAAARPREPHLRLRPAREPSMTLDRWRAG